MLSPQILSRAFAEAEKCDFFLAVGSSLVVYPAAEVPLRAKQRGATLAIINKERTPLDDIADYVIYDKAGKALPQIAQRLKMG